MPLLRTYFKTCLNTTGCFITTNSLEPEILSPPLKKGDLGGFQEVSPIPPLPPFFKGGVIICPPKSFWVVQSGAEIGFE